MPQSVTYYGRHDTPIPKETDIWNCRGRGRYKGCVKCPFNYGMQVSHIPGMENEDQRQSHRMSVSVITRQILERHEIPIKRCQNSWFISFKPITTKGWYEK